MEAGRTSLLRPTNVRLSIVIAWTRAEFAFCAVSRDLVHRKVRAREGSEGFTVHRVLRATIAKATGSLLFIGTELGGRALYTVIECVNLGTRSQLEAVGAEVVSSSHAVLGLVGSGVSLVHTLAEAPDCASLVIEAAREGARTSFVFLDGCKLGALLEGDASVVIEEVVLNHGVVLVVVADWRLCGGLIIGGRAHEARQVGLALFVIGCLVLVECAGLAIRVVDCPVILQLSVVEVILPALAVGVLINIIVSEPDLGCVTIFMIRAFLALIR